MGTETFSIHTVYFSSPVSFRVLSTFGLRIRIDLSSSREEWNNLLANLESTLVIRALISWLYFRQYDFLFRHFGEIPYSSPSKHPKSSEQGLGLVADCLQQKHELNKLLLTRYRSWADALASTAIATTSQPSGENRDCSKMEVAGRKVPSPVMSDRCNEIILFLLFCTAGRGANICLYRLSCEQSDEA